MLALTHVPSPHLADCHRTLLVNPEWIDTKPLDDFERIEVPDSEPWAANVVRVADRILMSSEQTQTVEKVRKMGYDVHTVPISEFAKAEGGLTCLSLIFDF